jgi:hypothetical protein
VPGTQCRADRFPNRWSKENAMSESDVRFVKQILRGHIDHDSGTTHSVGEFLPAWLSWMGLGSVVIGAALGFVL